MNPLPLDVAVKASVLLAAAGVVQGVLHRRGSAAARHLVWTIAIAGLLVLPIASAELPHWLVRIPVARAATAIAPDTPAPAAIAPDTPAPAAPKHAIADAAPLPAPAADTHPPAADGTSFGSLALAAAVYIAGVLLLLLRIGLQPFALRRLARAARTVADPAWRHDADRAARDLRVGRSVRLLKHAGDVMPMTFGVRQPTVILPASADGWTDDRRRAVLLHELAHVARHDCLTQTLTAVACAFYWPHPGVWWAARRLRVERELACDDRVLAAGTAAREYAGHLLEIAHTLGATPVPAIALGMARARQLEKRLLAVLDTARSRAAVERRGRVIAIVVAVVAVFPIAALRAAVVPFDAAAAPHVATGAVLRAAQPATARSTAQDIAGAWTMRLAPDTATVYLNMRTLHGSNGSSLPLARLDGVTASQISGTGTVHFTSRRDAGTFTFEGVCRAGTCGGMYTFDPNQAFAAELAKRGIGTPTPEEQSELAMEDVGLAFLDELSANGYTKPDVHGLVRAAQHGVGLDYVRTMAGLGYRVGTVDALIRLRDHGVDPEFVRGLAANGHARLSAEELVRARDHGVDPAYVKGMHDLGYGSTAIADLVAARDHGVDPAFARELAALGYQGLSLDALIRARDHGVDPEFVRGLASLGYTGLKMDALVAARDHGVDPAYVGGLAALGYKGVPLDALIRMRDHGVDPDYVRRLQERGVKDLTVDQLIQRRDRGSEDPDAAARTHVQFLRQQSLMASVQSFWRSIVARLGT